MEKVICQICGNEIEIQEDSEPEQCCTCKSVICDECIGYVCDDGNVFCVDCVDNIRNDEEHPCFVCICEYIDGEV